MKTSIAVLVGIVGLLTGAVSLGPLLPASTAHAQPTLPGMCSGRTDANVGVNAHANGQPSEVPKYILNVSTDDLGAPSGTLVLGRGRDRLLVDDWCRLWQHLPGQPFGDHCQGEDQEGSINAHAVGIGTLSGGQEVLVRTDIRANAEGKFFRLRYRAMGEHHTEDTTEADGCDDESWTRVPEHGWHPLRQLKVHLDLQ